MNFRENQTLVCTFVKKEFLDDTIQKIEAVYGDVGNIIVLNEVDNINELILVYNIPKSEKKLDNTMLIHRSKGTRTLYTINAINLIPSSDRTEDGNPNWFNYQDSILLKRDGVLSVTKTNLVKVIS